MAGDVLSVRFARCPKCHRVHTERSNVSVYNCTGCGTILRARHSPAKEEEENPPQSQEIPETNLRTTNSLPPMDKNPPSISISDDSSEAKSSVPPIDKNPPSISISDDSSEAKNSVPPVQSPPPATAGADTCSNSGSLSSSDDPPAKRDKHNRLSRRTFKSNKKTTTESSSTNSAKFGYVDDLSFASLSSDTTSNDLAGAPTTKLENLRIEDNDGWRDRRSSPWRRSAAAEKVTAQPQLVRRGSLEDEAGSSCSDGSHRRQGSEIQRAMAQPKRRHCRAVAGAAPLVLCNGCEELLQLPADFLLFPGRRRLRCGSCSKVLTFWFAAGGRLRPARGTHN